MRTPLYLMALPVAIVLGCTPDARDRAKRFFFEVPEESPASTATADASANSSTLPELHLPPSAFVSVHQPYADQQCDACHSTEKRMKVEDQPSTTCGECHEDFFDKALVKHDPVAGGDCMQCHVPHRSRFPALLIRSVLDTCVECHDAEDLSKPAHAGEAVGNCAACHDAHFGAEHLLKKDFVPAKSSATP